MFVVVVCAEATPVINAVLSNAAAKYFVIIASKTVNLTNALARFGSIGGTLSSEVLVVGPGTEIFGIRLSYTAVNQCEQSEGGGNFQGLGLSSWEPIVAR